MYQVLKELIGDKTVEKIVKPKPAIDENFIKWFNCVKVCEKKKDQSKWFSRSSIFCGQEYKV